jgi:SAM-dependent methyltransferase
MIGVDSFDKSLEIDVYVFGSFEEWRNWREENPWFSVPGAPSEIAEHCLVHGIKSGWFGNIPSDKVTCVSANYRESLRGNGFNPRQRAVLETLVPLTQGNELRLEIYAAEGITPFAKQLKDRYPKFTGSEYAPTEAEQARIAPVKHQDLAALSFGDASFDICMTNEVMEHLPDLKASLAELQRVLRPGGILLSTFPFLQNRRDSIIKARMLADGSIQYLTEPEYHGNPVDPSGGSLVFQVPAWDIIDLCLDVGFSRANIILLSSRKSGIIARDYPGIFLLFAFA